MLVVNHDEKEKQFLSSKPTTESATEREATKTKVAVNKSLTVALDKEKPAQKDKIKKDTLELKKTKKVNWGVTFLSSLLCYIQSYQS